MTSWGELTAGATVLTAEKREITAAYENGFVVEYWLTDATGRRVYVIAQKRGETTVTVYGESERGAHEQWADINEKGYYYDWRQQQRVTIPGAR